MCAYTKTIPAAFTGVPGNCDRGGAFRVVGISSLTPDHQDSRLRRSASRSINAAKRPVSSRVRFSRFL